MNPFFHTDFSISDSLKTVRKSVLIYETIIVASGLQPTWSADSDVRFHTVAHLHWPPLKQLF